MTTKTNPFSWKSLAIAGAVGAAKLLQANISVLLGTPDVAATRHRLRPVSFWRPTSKSPGHGRPKNILAIAYHGLHSIGYWVRVGPGALSDHLLEILIM